MTKSLKIKRFITRLAGCGVLISLLVAAHLLGLIDFVPIYRTLVSHSQIVLECLILAALSFSCVALRLAALLKLINMPVSFSDALRITMLSQFSGTIFAGPIGAEATRFGMLVKRCEHRYTELTTLLLFDRIFGLLGLVCIVFFMSFAAVKVSARIPYHHYIIAAGLLFSVALATLFIIHKHLATKKKHAVKALIKSCSPHLYKLLSQLGRVFRTFRNIMSNPLTLLKLVGFSVLASLLPLFGFSEIIKIFLPNIFDFPSGILILAITILFNSIGITPGGIGVGEGVFGLLGFLATGDSSLPYIETFLTIRLISIMCVLPGGLFLLQAAQPKTISS